MRLHVFIAKLSETCREGDGSGRAGDEVTILTPTGQELNVAFVKYDKHSKRYRITAE